MIEWLREEYHRPAKPAPAPTIELSGRTLPIALNRHPRAKRLTLRLAPDGSAVRITLPRWCRSADAVAFAAVRREWLEAQLAKVPAAADPVARGTIRYRGDELGIRWAEDAPRKPALEERAIVLGGPRDTLPHRLQRWLESEAVRLMRADLAHYCARAGLAAPDLRLTRAQRRWGSCSSKGVVRVNWRLVQAPDPIRRSVVAHETAHLVHFDHSPDFHALLRDIYEDDLAGADGWLKAHGRGLYADFG
ncbi:MAG: M48 family metallopeptidase [Alphaproteobacteria bacterium]|nr:M48 family metallopeptidase [Alphaproteobacteria bacterium]